MVVGALAVRHEAASAALVRSAIAADLEQQAVAPRGVDDVVLVASELVGNAITHSETATDDLDVSWDVDDTTVTVRVADPSETVPQRRTAAQTDTNGRGLAIVATLSADWGVRLTGHGKQVWARVPVSRAHITC